MKNVIIGLLLVVSLAFGGLWVAANRKLAQVTADRSALLDKVDLLQAQADEKAEEATALARRLETAQQESVANAGAAARLTVALTNQAEVAAAGETNKPANPLAEMFKSKEMRDMIKEQQKTVMGSMIDKNYAEFFKRMNLSPEQTAAMKELLMNKMLAGAELGMEMISGEMTAEQRAEMTKKIKESTDAINQQLKEMLGAENYAEYEAYEKTTQERQLVGQLADQLTDAPMSANQKELLTAAMSDEKQNFKFTTDFGDQQNFSEDIFSKFTEDRINLFLQEQEQLNQKYLSRAQTILSADQLAAYKKLLTNQQEMMKLSMSMAAKMFK